uniref:Uncharacterized protein n=1 Tax=Chromera velia CCMP2878 TaxID=1169474 RepID=A0A0G4HIB2_9ALVE|eukprot:Cvel_27783.t1-p1 / transcript=Cvel_27783.t1 / gene=Cvel_27783 / organism=Chromera_velia_CCMP2878 / gene_product=hypothetical protein / transcript_product=hypothetical protein / location=Cvel_scaffold3525:3748-4599(+) / protein_length=284 / sequence_SO=supercontig / SO=protein_coding / is_pseudo=false
MSNLDDLLRETLDDIAEAKPASGSGALPSEAATEAGAPQIIEGAASASAGAASAQTAEAASTATSGEKAEKSVVAEPETASDAFDSNLRSCLTTLREGMEKADASGASPPEGLPDFLNGLNGDFLKALREDLSREGCSAEERQKMEELLQRLSNEGPQSEGAGAPDPELENTEITDEDAAGFQEFLSALGFGAKKGGEGLDKETLGRIAKGEMSDDLLTKVMSGLGLSDSDLSKEADLMQQMAQMAEMTHPTQQGGLAASSSSSPSGGAGGQSGGNGDENCKVQ